MEGPTKKTKLIYLSSPGVIPLGLRELTGRILILNSHFLNGKHKIHKNQFFKAIGGDGCDPEKEDTTIQCFCLNDLVVTKYDRSDFVGIASPELIQKFFPSTVTIHHKDPVSAT